MSKLFIDRPIFAWVIPILVTLAGAMSTAELGRWLEERRDVRADYRAIFGEEPPDPGAVTLSIDSNDTHSRAESLIGPIRFSPS